MRIACTIAVLLALPLASLAAEEDPAEVPVQKVVLYSSGVGYFQHEGTVQGDASMKLSFKPDQLNDVLKSMVLQDLDGGTVTTVNYASRAPLTRALKSFAVNLAGNPDMGNLLRQLRGAPVTVTAPDRIAGKVLSVQQRQKKVVAGGATTLITETVLNLFADGQFKTIPVETIHNIKIDDPKLAKELAKALELIAGANNQQRKGLEINFTGKGKRRVRVGYVIEAPVWKVSYRLDMRDEGNPLLQGWAIAENTSDADWDKVELSLISGRPISFIMDLYTPLYVPRPVVRPELYASLRPQKYEENLLGQAKAAGDRRRGLQRAEEVALADSAAPREAQASQGKALKMDMSGARSVASAQEAGEMFQYTIKTPVTLERRRSAMLPIVNDAVKAEALSIYNAKVHAKHPLRGARLTNSTDLKLKAGPVTVYQEGAYAGDARLPNLAAGEENLLSYAMDLDVTVDSAQSSTSQITRVKVNKGVVYVTRLYSYSHTYTLKNNAGKDRTVLLEHPRRNGRTLISPEKPDEKTSSHYRFEVKIPAKDTGKLTVKEEQVTHQSIGLMDTNIDSLLWILRSGEIDRDVKEDVRKAIELRRKVRDIEDELKRLRKRLEEITSGQDRIRRNISSVGRDSSLGQRYIKKLADQEDEIEKIETKIKDARRRLNEAKSNLSEYLKDLSA